MAPLSLGPSNPRPPPHGPAHRDDAPVVAGPGRLPAAAAGATPGEGPVSAVFALTLLSAVDGSLLALAAAGQLETLGGALSVGLLVVAGAGSWLAARSAFGGRSRRRRDWAVLAALGALTLASTVAAAWLGESLARAATLHVLPKAAGVVALLVAAEVAGLRLPRLAAGRLPLPFAALAAGVALEVSVAVAGVAWTA
jgi:hypothetical protein